MDGIKKLEECLEGKEKSPKFAKDNTNYSRMREPIRDNGLIFPTPIGRNGRSNNKRK